MLTDVVSADQDEEVGRGENEDRQVRHCVLAKALSRFLSNFIPTDRCLAGQNIHVRGEAGGQREGGNEDDLQRGSKEVTLFLPCLPSGSPSSTDLETIDFIPAFAPEEVVSDYQGGPGGADVELRPRYVWIATTRKIKREQRHVGKPHVSPTSVYTNMCSSYPHIKDIKMF